MNVPLECIRVLNAWDSEAGRWLLVKISIRSGTYSTLPASHLGLLRVLHCSSFRTHQGTNIQVFLTGRDETFGTVLTFASALAAPLDGNMILFGTP